MRPHERRNSMRNVKRIGHTRTTAKVFAVMAAVVFFGLCCAGLLACGHTHNLGKVEGKAATCTEGGSKAYWQCDGCDELFADAEGKTPITSEEIATAAKGHTLKKSEAVAATCTAEGHTAYWTCSDCGNLYADAEGKTATTSDAVKIAKTAHNIVAVNGKDATCAATGVIAHWKCSACDTLFADAEGKTPTTADAVTTDKTAHANELNVTVADGIYLVGDTLTEDDLAFALKCSVCNEITELTDGVTVDLTKELVAGENTFTATYGDLSKSFTVTAVSMTGLSVTDSQVTITNSDAKKVGLTTEKDSQQVSHTFLGGSPNNYYGRIFIRYNLSLSEDTEVQIFLNTCIRASENKMNDIYSVKVNGAEITIGDDVKMTTATNAEGKLINDWFAQSYSFAGNATLLAGQNNVVEITRKNLLYYGSKDVYGNFTYNFFGIGVTPYVDADIAYTELCTHVCPHCGKCTDADSANQMCAEKCAGHDGEHFCQEVCPVCGGCKDAACEDPVCADKHDCAEFSVMNESVTAVKSDGTAVNKNSGEGNISANDSNAKKGMIKITYKINSDVATVAKLYIKTCSQAIENSLVDSYTFTAEGKPVVVDGNIKMPYNEANKWKDIRYTYVGEVNLIAGSNTIEIVRLDMNDRQLNDYTGFNFFGIALSGAAEFTFAS